jgi:hypothetical protein
VIKGYINSLDGEIEDFYKFRNLVKSNKMYPGIKDMSEDEIKELAEIEYKNHREDLVAKWNEFNLLEDKVLKGISILEEIMDIKIEEDISFFVTLQAISPVWAAGKCFWPSYTISGEEYLETSMHEISHFMWVDKWKKIDESLKNDDFERPSKYWLGQELSVIALLNDERMMEIFDKEQMAYPGFYIKEVEGKTVSDHVKDIYIGRDDMEDFMKKTIEFISENEETVLEAANSIWE